MTDCLPPTDLDPVVFATFAVAAGLGLLLAWVRAQRFFFGKRWFVLTIAAMIWWLVAAGLELGAPGLDCKVAFAQAAWPGIALLPVAWCLFLADYAFARSRRAGPGTWLAVGLGPALISAGALSNGAHGLMYTAATHLAVVDGRPSVVFGHGPLFFLAAGLLYVFLVAAVAITAAGAFRAHRAFRGFFFAMLVITAVPLVGNVGYIGFGFTLFGFDPTPFLFALVLLAFTGLIFTNRVFDIGTTARDILFYDTSNPILFVDSRGIVADANPAALAALGVERTAIGARLAAWPALGSLARAIAAPVGAPPPLPIAVGGRRFDVRALPVDGPLDRRGGRLGWLIHAHDITDIARLKDALAAERDYLATLMETSMSGILALDDAGTIVFANAEACRILGRPVAEIEGRRFDDPVWRTADPEHRPLDRAELPFSLALTRRGAVRDVRLSIAWPDGARRVLSVNAAPTDPERGPARVVLAIDDITDRLAVEAALRQAVARAEAANRTKSRFVANMSHEIRTPLNGVLGMAELLEDALTDPAHRVMARTIREAGALLLNVLNDILDVAKIEAGKLEIEAIPFDPAEVVARVAALHAPAAASKGVALEVETASAEGQARRGDPLRLMQILHNLVSNAVKFTERGRVHVAVGTDVQDRLCLTVTDTGIGMTGPEIARVFEDFEQADGSITRRYGGTGLGMGIVRRLVDLMGGTIAVESAPGAGTRVAVTLPLPPAPAAVAAIRPPGHDAAGLGGLRVLAADDSATNRAVLRAMLGALGVEATIVGDGAEAVAAWAPGRFDVVLLDISMPVMDGLGALSAIRAAAAAAGAPPPAAVAITANAMAHEVAAFAEAGFDRHLPKPFRRDDLAATLIAAGGASRQAG